MFATGVGLHRNCLIVLPRRCKIDLTQIPIARPSDVFRFAAAILSVFRTFLIHEHNFFAFIDVRMFLM